MVNLNSDSLISMENNLVDVQGMYYNNQRILFVGEGDFSFSSSHATQFGVANNIVATSLDSRKDLIVNYGMAAIENIKNLTDRGARVIHGVNACDMAAKDGSLSPVKFRRSFYDVVNYNFPHAGFFGFETNPNVIRIPVDGLSLLKAWRDRVFNRKHTKLMQEFFRNAALMLAPGGVIYVAHKCGRPYDDWNLQENAAVHGLEFLGSVPFRKSDFPGYKNRRGSGKRAGDTFELGEAAIYIFALRCSVWMDNIGEHPLETPSKEHFLLQILRFFKKDGSASSKTPLLQAVATEAAHLETLKLDPKEQSRLHSLKLVLQVMPLLVKTPAFAIHRIRSLQASSSYEETRQCWSDVQKVALEAMEAEQNIMMHEKLEHAEVSADKDGCSNEQQREEGVENIVSDDTTNGALDEEMVDSPRAFVVDMTPAPCSMDEPENIVRTDRGAKDTVPTICQGEVYFHLEYQSDMPGLGAFGVCELSSGAIEDMADVGDCLESRHLGHTITDWMVEYLFCCCVFCCCPRLLK